MEGAAQGSAAEVSGQTRPPIASLGPVPPGAGPKVVGVAEIQGLFGPVAISERVLHRLWVQQDFETADLRTAAGEPLVVLRPGLWNHHEGPDFRGAVWQLGGETCHGDVEMHFYEGDWHRHGHGGNPAFNGVGLHVVVYRETGPGRIPAQTASGREPAVLVLLPQLRQDLESIAAEQALEQLLTTGDGGLAGWLRAIEPAARLRRVREAALARWRQKVALARQRLAMLGWAEACHLSALEVLGYARNRAPMLRLAGQFPLAEMAGQSVEALYHFAESDWRLAGSRPENHPRKRLGQYLHLLAQSPAWPDALAAWGADLPPLSGDQPTRMARRQGHLAARRDLLAAGPLAGAIGGTRLETLVVDALLPLLAAETEQALWPWWWHWFRGDVPDHLLEVLRAAELTTPEQPLCHGLAQGVWQLLIEEPVAT